MKKPSKDKQQDPIERASALTAKFNELAEQGAMDGMTPAERSDYNLRWAERAHQEAIQERLDGRVVTPPGEGPRDVRKGDRWLPWHFTKEFEDRMKGGGK